LNVGGDSDTEWVHSGVFNDSIVTGDLSSEIEQSLISLLPDTTGYCEVPILVSNNCSGNLSLLNLNIRYNTSDYRYIDPIDNNTDIIYYIESVIEALDTDTDGLSDFIEDTTHGTDWNSSDTDADGLSDWDEVMGITDALLWDTDGDGLNDSYELLIAPTDPLNNDSDADGLLDGPELLTYLTDPMLNDTDADGLFDSEELWGSYGYFTNPLVNDTDADLLTDFEEITRIGTDPTNPDTDGDGVIDGLDSDPLVPWWQIYVIVGVLIGSISGAFIVITIWKKKKRRRR